MPLFFRICGRTGLCPKLSTLEPILAIFPKRLCKYRCPYRPCRTKASPHGKIQSGSINQPPVISQRPSATLCLISSNISGKIPSIHSKNAVEVEVNLKSANSFMRSSAEAYVAFTSCIPSSQFQNQTGSIWEFPIIYSFFFFIDQSSRVASAPQL